MRYRRSYPKARFVVSIGSLRRENGAIDTKTTKSRSRESPQERVSLSQMSAKSSNRGKPRLVGYARVCKDKQTTALQLDALNAAGCVPLFTRICVGSVKKAAGTRESLRGSTRRR